MHPLSIHITTRDSVEQREVHQHYVVETSYPRWELLKIFLHAFFNIRFR